VFSETESINATQPFSLPSIGSKKFKEASRMRAAALSPLLISFFIAILNADAQPTTVPDSPPVQYLEQGWSADDRQQFYYTTQGSQLIPYDWFLALRRPGSDERLSSDGNMERLRFISQPADDDRNRDGLPIGFVVDDNPQTVMEPNIKRAFLGPEFERQKPTELTNRWLGLTCAACHTANIEYQGKTVRIDGGAALADVQSFLSELSEAVTATVENDAAFERFAREVLEKAGTGYSESERDALRERVKNYAPALVRLVRRGAGIHPYGFGRLDAFGAILNEVCDTSLNIPTNYYPSDAPASFPFLWGAPQLDWVQWNGTADNPLGRNVGEVVGVFGQLNLAPEPVEDRFKSTAHFQNLVRLEDQLQNLQAPPWPVETFGELDDARIAQGKKLFLQNCADCHAVRDAESNEFPLTKPNRFGKQFVRTHMIKLDEIGTDPALAINFATRTADAGSLMAPGTDKVPRPQILEMAVGSLIQKKIDEHQPPLDAATILQINGYRDPAATPPNAMAYKARPLEGIWATAPYLHNGSVPNLYELLLPANRRSKSFFVGNQSFDPKQVGYVTSEAEGAFEFRVENETGPVAGNANTGHDGHGLGTRLGYTETYDDGEWREFTEEERYALIEFMKSQGPLEEIPAAEPSQIQNVVSLTMQQLKNRYPGNKPVLRGVHAKDHGCVTATFEIAGDLPEKYRVGVFSQPGQVYDAWVRFSNAATLVLPDDPVDPKTGKPAPGSRGMAIKLLGVEGTPLVAPHGSLTQDFLLVNHPVFAFANVEDYEVLSRVLADPANREDASKFFGLQFAKGGAAAERAKKSLEIIGRIRAADVASGAFQSQPGSPVDCRYFSGAPFAFGDGAVMKFSATPVSPEATPANPTDPSYLRNALMKRLEVRDGNQAVVFKFQVQCRPAGGLNVAEDIENACNEWTEERFPFTTVATLTIPPQDFDLPERRAVCETLFFSPWHGIAEHRPLGGINRMRRAVYEASSGFRHQPKEPETR
jgi:hypothetical protein